MPVIFDEVNATVEPGAETGEGETASRESAADNDAGLDGMERWLAREKWLRERLRAD